VFDKTSMLRLVTRIVTILILALSIGALALAARLFQQRETLKGRTQKLEEAIHKVAATIEAGGATNATLKIADAQLKTFKSKPGGPPSMDAPLKELVTSAQGQLVRLNNTRTELSETKLTLAKTEEDLKDTKLELSSAQTKLKEQETVIETKNNIIGEKEAAITKLEGEKTELTAKVEEVNNQLAEAEAETAEMSDDLSNLEERYVTYEASLYPEWHKKAILRGQQGVVAYVNPDWNFLVVRLTPESMKTTTANLEFLVYRVDKLIGKARVSSVSGDLAVADILDDWQQAPPQNGDGILY